MDDLFEKLQGILSSEEGQEQLKTVAQMLGITENAPKKQDVTPQPAANDPVQNEQASGLDLAAISQMLSSLSGPKQQTQTATPENTTQSQGSGGFDLSGIDMNMILKVQQMIKGMNTDDDNTRLLMALKPHFSEKRRAKVDQVIQMLRLYALLPFIKDTGLLGGLFGNGDQ